MTWKTIARVLVAPQVRVTIAVLVSEDSDPGPGVISVREYKTLTAALAALARFLERTQPPC